VRAIRVKGAGARSRARAPTSAREGGLADKGRRLPLAAVGGQAAASGDRRALGWTPSSCCSTSPPPRSIPSSSARCSPRCRSWARDGMTMIVVPHEMGSRARSPTRSCSWTAAGVVEQGAHPTAENHQPRAHALVLSKVSSWAAAASSCSSALRFGRRRGPAVRPEVAGAAVKGHRGVVRGLDVTSQTMSRTTRLPAPSGQQQRDNPGGGCWPRRRCDRDRESDRSARQTTRS